MHRDRIFACVHRNEVNAQSSVNEDDTLAELDEPPESLNLCSRPLPTAPFNRSAMLKREVMPSSSTAHCRNKSLLTQALLVSPVSTPGSDAEAPMLTSDGGLTSPARTNSPSPPLPATQPNGLAGIATPEYTYTNLSVQQRDIPPLAPAERTDSTPTTDLETGLGRKRCIKFACGRQAPSNVEHSQPTKVTETKIETAKNSTKRPCMLRFVCPTKPASGCTRDRPSSTDLSSNDMAEGLPSARKPSASIVRSEATEQCPITLSANKAAIQQGGMATGTDRPCKPCIFNPVDLEGSEATRFHEFAGPHDGEDEWVHEQTAYRRKVTVNDTLQKENAIRKLGEEAEEEAREEEDAADEAGEYHDLDDATHELSSDDNISDGGNETDDEEGFAESDDESAMGSDYQFWTPGLTTAATSADHLEHPRLSTHRAASTSSVESMINVKDTPTNTIASPRPIREDSRMRLVKPSPVIPDLPDSTDFVCGTLDEDRPLEAAYMSCLEERRRCKRRVIPQDIDPSFPTSDLETEKDGNDKTVPRHASDEAQWMMGKLDHSEREHSPPQRKPLSRRNTKSPMPSPQRMRSPPPPKRNMVHRSPPPRGLAQPSSEGSSSISCSEDESEGVVQPRAEKSSTGLCPRPAKPQRINMCHVQQRPQLTHTTSLPRTPNPFWAPNHHWSHALSAVVSPESKVMEVRSRGPIDIVTGLETKRQRRKEKFWRQHCRNGAKDKDRRCQPGQGAERMRELGLEMAGKNRGYVPQAQLMLSA
ncbi:MAG: hypothetical protein Q9174_000074 [Haloplaca sp. 1 TL-2023]